MLQRMPLTPSALPDISPTGGEIGKTRYRRFSTVELVETSRHIDLPPCGGDARQGRGG